MEAIRKKRIQRDWVSIFEKYGLAGMTVKEFCCAERMSQSLFYRRRKDIEKSILQGKLSLKPNDFIQLQGSVSPVVSVSIVFPGSIELFVHNDCDGKLLRDIISQLKVPSC